MFDPIGQSIKVKGQILNMLRLSSNLTGMILKTF